MSGGSEPVFVCEASWSEPGMPIRVVVDGLPPLAVFNVDGEIFVTDDTCTHGEASLSEGYMDGDEIECPWHSGKFCVRDGAARIYPAAAPLATYQVSVIDGHIYVRPRAPVVAGIAVSGCSRA